MSTCHDFLPALHFVDDYRLTMCMNILKWAIGWCEDHPQSSITEEETQEKGTRLFSVLPVPQNCSLQISHSRHFCIIHE